MVKFEEPKVEIIKIKTEQTVYASPNGGAGNVQSCNGGVMDEYKYCQEKMVATGEGA